MHELSIALSLLDAAEAEADLRELHVVAIHLKLGPLSGVVREALLSAFDLAREGSSLPDARLVIEDIPLIVYCSSCQKQQPAVSLQHLCCPVCGTPTPQVITGRELEISALEVTDEATGACIPNNPAHLPAPSPPLAGERAGVRGPLEVSAISNHKTRY